MRYYNNNTRTDYLLFQTVCQNSIVILNDIFFTLDFFININKFSIIENDR
jgi:hypothetical protein